jgi:hypothetical protein
MTYDEAWYHSCKWQRERWRTAITKETTKMAKHVVWKKVKRNTIPEGRKCIKHKWVFDIKRDGTFRAW